MDGEAALEEVAATFKRYSIRENQYHCIAEASPLIAKYGLSDVDK